MSFLRHQEIFPSDGGANLTANTPAHRLDEFPAGYSLAGCSPAWPASASPTGTEYAVQSVCRSRNFHRTARCVLTVCVSRGDKRIAYLEESGVHLPKGRWNKAVLSFEFSDSVKERSVTVWPPSRASYKRDDDRMVVEQFLKKNQFLKASKAKKKASDELEAAVGRT